MQGNDMENPYYYIQDCPDRGLGVFSNKSFRANDYIMSFTGKLTPFSEIMDFTHYLQFAPDMFLGPSGGADDYVNHSCDPNCSLYFENNKLVLRAIRDIEAGEELSFDYGTVQFTEPTNFECKCGSSKCRGNISNFYALPDEVKQNYLKKNMVPLLSLYTLEEIKAAASNSLVA